MTPETKKKIADSKRNRPRTEKELANLKRMAKGNKGKKLSSSHKRKIGLSRMGELNWSKRPDVRVRLSLSKKGENHPNWKGGVTSQNKIIRHSIEFRLWRESVFARDNWCCQKCKIRGGGLHPHHILNFSEYPKLRFAIDNGITLHKKCHSRFHKLFGYTKNTKLQLTNYLNEKS